jgi:hypothetical protein
MARMTSPTQHTLWPGHAHEPTEVLVHWVCRSTAHRDAPSRGGRGGLTVHGGRWAYCDGLVDDDRHEWAPTGGVTIERLVDWTKALDRLRARTVRR